LFLLSCLFPPAFSQIPEGFNYQAIARDGTTGNPIPDPVDVKIAILSDDDPVTIIREELFSAVDPDEHGLFSIVVGQGAYSSGPVTNFSDIDWTVTPKYILTKIFYGGDWQDLGPAQLWSVPYAMQSKDTEAKQSLSLSGYDLTISGANTITLPTGSSLWETDGTNIYRIANKVGIGTTPSLSKLHVLETSATSITYPLFLQNGSSDWTATEKGVGLRFARSSNFSAHGLGTIRGSIADADGGHGRLQFIGGPGDIPHITIDWNGAVGIGTTTPGYRLDVKGRIRTISDGPYVSGVVFTNVAGNGNRGLVGMYNDDYISFYGSGGAGWGLFWNVNNGNLGIGTTSPTSKLVVQPDASWDDNTPLFEVKNKSGVPVLAVYNNGVRINVEHDPDGVKGPKGGFAIGGYDYTKGGTVTLMNVTPDSIRFNINNDNAKGPKGGFAIGGFDYTKGTINEDFMYITPQTSGDGQYNTYLGYKAGISSSTAVDNVMIGYNAGYFNSAGSQNVFIGKNAGQYNRTGNKNVIMGWSDYLAFPLLDPGDIGSNNTLIGYSSGLRTKGDENTALGYLAGKVLFDGDQNTLIGSSAGKSITSGLSNVCVGVEAGINTTGDENVFVGGAAGSGHTTGSNNIAIGTDAQLLSNTASNQIRMGDTRITYAEIQVAWTVPSDLKWKESVEELALGLNLVKGLRPVDYIRKNNSSGTREAGFIAQDVQELFSSMGINNSGLLSVDADGSLALRYNDFIPILTRAMQEQQQQIEAQNQKIERLEKMIFEMKEKIASSLRSSQ
jgi:hypothetical protein